MASPSFNKEKNMWTVCHELPISSEDIGQFVGGKGINLRKHIIQKSNHFYSKTEGAAEGSPPRVSIIQKDDKVFAECEAHCEELLVIMRQNLDKHSQVFKVKKSSPKKPTICKLVFKTKNVPIGKYIGNGGKNCKALAEELQELAKKRKATESAESFRVNIIEPDVYDSTPKKYFEIKNGEGGYDQFIFVTAKYNGDIRALFQTIKKKMIDSVVSLNEQCGYNEDFLCGGTAMIAEPTDQDSSDDDEETYQPPSPTPLSP